jgi:hypoxanthine phosphoribosyltransferase
MPTIKIHDKFFKPFITQSQIQSQISTLATRLSADYTITNPLFLVVLNGSFIFAADLLRQLPIGCEVSFTKLASYQGTQTTGTVNQLIGLQEKISDRHVIIIEDIIDTGLTIHSLLQQLNTQQPASVKIVTLLVKPSALIHPLSIDYIGFEIENKFVLGYGLDYDGLGRNLPEIYVEV